MFCGRTSSAKCEVERLQRAVIYAACAIFAAALVRHFYVLGGPYFAFPETSQDHVSVQKMKSRDAIVICSRASRLLPPGVRVRVEGDDLTLTYVAIGVMPFQTITTGDADYVITVGDAAFRNPAYRLAQETPEGKIYTRR